MIRRILAISILTAFTAIGLVAVVPATFVLSSGERVSGVFDYKGGNDFTLNGRDYPQDQVAIIAFVSGDPAAAELNQLPQSDNPAELDRHMIVTRDGKFLHGKLYRFSPDGQTVTYDPREGGLSARRDLPTGQIARIYVSAPAARSIYSSVLSAPATAAVPVATSGAVAGGMTVNANQPWTDTGINVKKGDRVAFTSSGQIRVTNDGSPEGVAGPDGSGTFHASRTGYPVPGMAVGGLIGKVGNGAAFPIGSNSQPITMPAPGRLYLGVNDDNFSDNSGSFVVTIVR